MLPQFEHFYYSSFLLYLDYQLLYQAQAYTNYSGFFYPVNSYIQGLYAYASPFRQFVGDISISGANVMSGVYLNNTFVTPGTSGLTAINYSLGTIYFNQPLPKNTVVSGNYAVKDINVLISDEQEYDLLYNTKYVINSQFNQVLSGLDPETYVEPAIFLRYKNADYRDFAFQGLDDNRLLVRATIITDYEYERIGISHVIKNLKLHTFPIVSSATPLDYAGNYTGGQLYNYNNLPPLNGTGFYTPWIWSTKIIDIPFRGEFMQMKRNIGRKVYLADVDISCVMVHL